MPSLPEIQHRFAAALDARRDGEPPGMEVYRHAIAANYRRALGATYAIVRRIVGDGFFDAAVDAFVAESPPASGDLNVYGAGLASFLAQYAPALELAYLPDVARLEWAIDESSRAAGADMSAEAVIAEIGMVPEEGVGDMRLELDPSCRLLASSYPLFDIWRVHQPGHDGDMRIEPQRQRDERLLVRRGAEGVAIERIAPAEHAWLVALHEGTPFSAALARALEHDDGFDLSDALARRVRDGTIRAVAQSSVM